jgi:hypothetical protein
MAESAVQKWVRDKLENRYAGRIYLFKVPQGQYTSRRGIPDLVAGIGGRFYAFEIKTDSGKLTPLQSHEITKINKAGSTAVVIYGKDEAMLNAIFRQIDSEINPV